jgi:hypothetical protein
MHHSNFKVYWKDYEFLDRRCGCTWLFFTCNFIWKAKDDGVYLRNDECYLVLVHTPLFTFVRPLVLLIFTNLTCFVCFVLIRSLHHKLTEGANGHEES